MDKQLSFDAIVVGNGALGLATAINLLKRKQTVALVGPAQRTTGASKAAGAMNGCFGEVTSELLSSDYGKKKLEVDVQATVKWDAWSTEIASDAGVSPDDLRTRCGTTVILNSVGTGPVDSGNFEAIQAALKSYQAPFEILGESELDWLQPQASARPLRALHIPGEHCIRTPAYLEAAGKAVEKLGGVIFDAEVSELLALKDNSFRGVKLNDGTEISAAIVVLATGAHSVEVLRKSSPELARQIPPMVSGYGVSVIVETPITGPAPTVIRTPNRAFACGLHVVPRSDDTIYLGATNIISNSPQVSAALSDLHFLLECGMKQLHTDLSRARVKDVQVGNRPVPVDGFPLIGQVGDSNVWLFTGTYRDGFHQSPLIADKLVDQILSVKSEAYLPEFSPVRRPIQSNNRQQIVSTAVEHMLATGYEADWRVPVEWPPRIRRHLVQRYLETADELHSEFTPPAEILVSVVGNDELRSRLRSYYEAYAA